ncbi:microsomal triglyceride transfer protein large subunit [Melanaphis sacchari]|uniref:microsomal triglyceride transfer protein large subunit n=1 Tax=Melanaphis sacchari TaxID=742174 RepID=UPI000DC14BA5|nr:microsomal triglyceride transfer protein large subunit [Melanaphis sacchari]
MTSSTDWNAVRAFSLLLLLLSLSPSMLCSAEVVDDGHRLFSSGVRYEYESTTTVLAGGSADNRNPEVGHRVVGRLSVERLWPATETAGEKLLRLHFKSLKFQTWSKKSKNDINRQFIDRKSRIDRFSDQPFFVHWKNGHVENLYISSVNSLTEENFKKGIAGLFQFQLSNQHTVEYSTLGKCNVTYSKINENSISKRIEGCVSPTTLPPEIKHPDKIWQGTLRSKREGSFIYNHESFIDVSLDENHEFSTSFMNEVGASVSSTQHLKFIETKQNGGIIEANTFEEAINQLEKQFKLKLEKQNLSPKHEVKNCKHYNSCNKLSDVVKKYHDSLLDSELGKSKSAFGAIKVIDAIVNSDTKTIKKVLTDKKNENIIVQLYDLLGAALNENSHKASMETLVFTDDAKSDEKIERYLWSASIKFNPKIEIIKSLMSISDEKLTNRKIMDTLFNTVTAMASRLARYNHTDTNALLCGELVVKTLEKLEKCKLDDDECILTYIRALSNLKHPLSIEVLLSFAQHGNRMTSAYAMKTIKMFGPSLWNSRVLKYCNRIFFQLVKEQDSSTRAIALAILLESNPDYDLLKHVIKWLATPGEGYEIKQYALELLKEMANQNETSARLLRTVLVRERLNHYGNMAQRGLSSCFSRKFINYNNITGLVKNSQQIYSGVTKRGSVDIALEHENIKYDLCSFGMFTTGLGYFTSLYDDSGKKDTSDEANLPATAGLELIIFGVHIRPFIMFSNQGQLMGHVWAGTGSDKTPIIQGISQMIEHLEYVPLSNGITAELNVKGTLSLDISGQIEMSLWNKNAQSVIEKNGGVSIQGSLKLDTDLVTDEVDFALITEGLLHMHSEAEFATKIVLCMRIVFVDTNVTTTVSKNQKVHGLPHKSYTTTTRTHPVSGRTFALNQMVNEFCNTIHSR